MFLRPIACTIPGTSKTRISILISSCCHNTIGRARNQQIEVKRQPFVCKAIDADLLRKRPALQPVQVEIGHGVFHQLHRLPLGLGGVSRKERFI